MGNRLLNESFIRQRSEELQIPFENLLIASVLEEIVQRIGESEYADGLWLKNSSLDLEHYRKNVDLSLSYYIKDMQKLQYKKADISNVFMEIFRNLKQEAIQWNCTIKAEQELLYANLVATISTFRVPVKIKFEQVKETDVIPSIRNIRLFTNNNRKIQVKCFPGEYMLAEKFLDVMEKLELINDLSCYMDIYEILKKEIISGRKVWALLIEGCRERRMVVDEERFQLLVSYRNNSYMKKKWKIYLRHERKTRPTWDEMLCIIEDFFSNIWISMCRNLIYLGDWMPELGRFID